MQTPFTEKYIKDCMDSGRKHIGITDLRSILELHEAELIFNIKEIILEKFDQFLYKDEIRESIKKELETDRAKFIFLRDPPIIL